MDPSSSPPCHGNNTVMNSTPPSPVHSDDGYVAEWEASFDEVDSEAAAPSPLRVLTSVDQHDEDDDEDSSISSLTLIRKVVRSLAVMPPSVRQALGSRRHPLSPSSSRSYASRSRRHRSLSPRHHRMPYSLSSLMHYASNDDEQEQAVVMSSSEDYSSSQDSIADDERAFGHSSLPRDFFSAQRSLIFDGIDMEYPTGALQVFMSSDAPTLLETSSTSCSVDETLVIPPVPTHLQEFHFRWWGHGMLWTIVGIMAALLGSGLAILARKSTEFTKLDEPMVVAPIYEDVHAMGLLQFEVCYNTTVTSRDNCQVFDLKAEDVDDVMFELSRILLTVAAFLGVLLTICLSTATAWESINLRPVGLGFLFVYFCQAFAMLFFDSRVCHEYKCRMGLGCIQCLVASGFWVVAGLATAKMDMQKTRLRRRRKRRAKRHVETEEKKAAVEATKKKILCRRESSVAPTDKTSSNGSVVHDLEESLEV